MLTDKYAPHPGGTAVLWSQWCARWPAAQVTVLCPRVPGYREFDARAAGQVVRIPFPDLPKLRMPCLWAATLLRAAWEMRAHPADVLHLAQLVPYGLWGPWLKRLYGVPYLLHVYGEEIPPMLGSPWKRSLLLWTLRESAGVTAISRFTSGLLAKAGYTGEVLLAPPAPGLTVPESFLPVPRPSPGPVLLTVGRLMERKGQDRVLALMPRLRERYPDLIYLVAGVGPYQARLKEMVTGLRLESCVRFLGRVPQEDLYGLYRQADLFVHPNRSLPGGDVEGFGIVLLEASLCGLPVLAGRSGGVCEAVLEGQTGLLVSDSPEELWGALVRLLDDPALRDQLGQQGRAWAQTFDWAGPASKVWALTQEVARAKARPPAAPG